MGRNHFPTLANQEELKIYTAKEATSQQILAQVQETLTISGTMLERLGEPADVEGTTMAKLNALIVSLATLNKTVADGISVIARITYGTIAITGANLSASVTIPCTNSNKVAVFKTGIDTTYQGFTETWLSFSNGRVIATRANTYNSPGVTTTTGYCAVEFS